MNIEKRKPITRYELLMILSTHVDDLKGGAEKELAARLLAHLEKYFGKCKAEYQKFIHTGVVHEKLVDKVICHQIPYISKLKPMPIENCKGLDELTEVEVQMSADYSSLLGGVAWTLLTRAEAAIYVQSLQRHGSKPQLINCRRLNILLRYLVRHPTVITYRKLGAFVRLLGFSDSAFKAQEGESAGLALRGLATMLTDDPFPNQDFKEGDPAVRTGVTIDGRLLDWLVRRLRRVVRSTFSAELNAFLDSLETLLLLQMTLHQVYCGTDESVEELLIRLEQGSLYPPIDAVLDARSVTDAVAASDCTTPQEASLKLHLLAIRDRLARGLLRSVSWCDTRDMLGDGLTKGGIDRKLLQDAMAGFINMKHEVKTKWGQVFRNKYDPVFADRNAPFAHVPNGDLSLLTKKDWQTVMVLMYESADPDRIKTLDDELLAFEGDEAALCEQGIIKYGDKATEAVEMAERLVSIRANFAAQKHTNEIDKTKIMTIKTMTNDEGKEVGVLGDLDYFTPGIPGDKNAGLIDSDVKRIKDDTTTTTTTSAAMAVDSTYADSEELKPESSPAGSKLSSSSSETKPVKKQRHRQRKKPSENAEIVKKSLTIKLGFRTRVKLVESKTTEAPWRPGKYSDTVFGKLLKYGDQIELARAPLINPKSLVEAPWRKSRSSLTRRP